MAEQYYLVHTFARLFPAAMALSSCGIAYAMRYVRATMSAGVQSAYGRGTRAYHDRLRFEEAPHGAYERHHGVSFQW